jgi:hypothetical protein
VINGLACEENGAGRGRPVQCSGLALQRGFPRCGDKATANNFRIWPSAGTADGRRPEHSAPGKGARPLGLAFGVVGRECRVSDGVIPYNPSPYNKEAYNTSTQSEQV